VLLGLGVAVGGEGGNVFVGLGVLLGFRMTVGLAVSVIFTTAPEETETVVNGVGSGVDIRTADELPEQAARATKSIASRAIGLIVTSPLLKVIGMLLQFMPTA
jgi:hypothetical protein